MEKKFLIVLLALLCIPLIFSIPQFLIFQGEARIDGRIAQGGNIIFSINGIKISETNISDGNYGPVLIQGFSELYGKPISITIDGSLVEQKIDYTSFPQNIFLNLSAITTKGLNITDFYPSKKEIEIYKTGVQNFNITTSTGYDDSVNYTWFLDGSLVYNKTLYNYTIGDYDSGEHTIIAVASDGYLTRTKEWILKIKKPGKSSFDGSTTNFSSLKLDELGNVKNVILEKKSKGKIEFLEGINLTGIDNLEDIVKIEKGIIAVDSKNYPGLNKSAKITLTGLSYNSIPKIYYDKGFTTNSWEINKECDFCEIISYTPHPTTNGTIIFNVEHFTSFYIAGSGEIYNFSELDELDTCKNGEIGNLIVTIKKPGKGDDFNPLEEIKVKILVKNSDGEKKNVVVEATLYNLDEEDREEEIKSDSQKISAGKSETFDLQIEVPDNFEEEDDYILFVKAYEKGEEENQCSQEAINLNLEREDNDLRIKEAVLSPKSVYFGGSIDIYVRLENLGNDDEEEIYITAKNSLLGIYEKIGPFEIEEYGEKDTLSEILSVKIPKDAEEGVYDLLIDAEGKESRDSTSEKFTILESKPQEILTKDIIYLDFLEEKSEIDSIPLTGKTEKSKKAFQLTELSNQNYIFIDVALFISIITFAILIQIVRRRKFR